MKSSAHCRVSGTTPHTPEPFALVLVVRVRHGDAGRERNVPDAWLSLCVVCENWRVDASILFFLLLFEFFAFLVIRFVFV